MEYSICKDSQPRETVKKIKNILANLGINLKERIIHFDYTKKNSPRSIRIYCDYNYQIGTNGKGNCYINSRASAYAEFMERLQNIALFNQESLKISLPDKSFFNENQLLKSRIKKIYNNDNILKLLNKISEPLYNNKGKIIMTPWYSVKDKQQVLLPISIIQYLQCSNGMAAGNTLEEAIVQGMSEICERYVMKQVIFNRISLPEIPRNEYMKYNKIKGMIEYIESLGIKIKFRDASLGKKLPVVCGVLEFTNEEKFIIKFGSHPSFPIAIERTITEIFQGLNINPNDETNIQKNINFISDSYIKNKLYVYEQLFQYTSVFSSKNKLVEIFFNKKNDKNYTNNAFLEEGVILNNKQILKFLLKNINPLTKNEIFIRDVSFLGFPSVYIYIPSMSILRNINKNQLEKLYEINELYWSDNIKDNNQVDKFLNMVNKYYINYEFNPHFINLAILLLYSILKNDQKMIDYYLNYTVDSSQKYFILISEYLKLKDKYKDKNIIKKKLLENNNEKDVNYIFKVLDTLSINVIKILLLQDREKHLTPPDNNIENLSKRLIEAYRKNIPNQNNLKNII